MTNIPQKEIDYFERINSVFLNQKIKTVFYEELDYQDDIEYWEYSKNIHSVDMNIIFEFEDEKTVQIKWDNEFHCYGIGFEENYEIKKREGFRTINVTENLNWKTLIDKNISSIDIFWDESESQEYQSFLNIMIPKGRKKKIKVPLTWSFKIGNKNLYISAREIRDNSENYYWADHLTIFFDEQDLEKYNLNNACR